MSILLEALRKSEKIQHSRDVPTIYEDDHSDPASETIKTGPLTLLLVATLFIIGWFVWRQYQPPILDTQVPATSAGQAAIDTHAPATSVADHVPAATTPVASAEPARNMPPTDAAADSPDRQERTPMESYQPPANNVSPSKPAGVEPSGVTSGVTGQPVQTPDSDVGKKVKPVVEKRSPAEPAPISYWDLPDAVRADLPEIKFSVLVFDNKPSDRFVLINGERLVEGDSPQAGLKVKEIRRDGVVFSYRLYQFLIEK